MVIAPGPRKDSAGPSPCPRCSVTLSGDGAKPGRLPFSPHEPLGDAAPRQLELLLLFSRFALLELTDNAADAKDWQLAKRNSVVELERMRD